MPSFQNLANPLQAALPLLQMLLVALSFHFLILPLLWFAGWALPWPKPPAIKTVIEIDLQNWPRLAVPTGVGHVIVPEGK
jgi:hypothetical protein